METSTALQAPPSALRLPVTILLALTAPPLALAAWIFLSGSERTRYLRSKWVRLGVVLLAVGILPLLAIIVSASIGLWPDPNPNPIGPGLFLLAVGIIGCLCILLGVIHVAFATRRP